MGAANYLQYIQEEADDRGLSLTVTATGCLNLCSQGPILFVQPNIAWYGGIYSEDKIDEILAALSEGEVCEKYLISEYNFLYF